MSSVVLVVVRQAGSPVSTAAVAWISTSRLSGDCASRTTRRARHGRIARRQCEWQSTSSSRADLVVRLTISTWRGGLLVSNLSFLVVWPFQLHIVQRPVRQDCIASC